jgi:hypothetical protein
MMTTTTKISTNVKPLLRTAPLALFF